VTVKTTTTWRARTRKQHYHFSSNLTYNATGKNLMRAEVAKI